MKATSTEWDFDVDTVPAPSFIHNGLTVNPGGFYNVRRDTGESLGHVSNRYGLVQNRDVIGQVEDAFKNAELPSFDRKVIVTGNGERLFATYDFKDRTRVLKVGDEIGMRLTVQNSFDGKLKLSFAIGALRLICTNGMSSMEKDVDMVSKHNSNIDISFLTDAVKSSIPRFESACANYDALASVEFDHEKGFNILNRLAKAKVVSERHAKKIAAIWQSPDYKEDESRSLWNLYNASTQYLTREVQGKTFERSNTMNLGILSSLTNIARRGTISDWTAPVPGSLQMEVVNN